MKKLTLLLMLSISAIFSSQHANADILIELSDVTVAAGSTGVVTASISDTSATPAVLSGFNIPLTVPVIAGFNFDFNNLNTAITSANTGLTQLNPSLPAAGATFNYDIQISDGQGSIQLSATPTALFDIIFDVDPGAIAGSVTPVSIQEFPEANGTPLPTFFSLTLDGAAFNVEDIAGATVGTGSVTVAGVPEPSSIALAMAAFSGLLLQRRRS